MTSLVITDASQRRFRLSLARSGSQTGNPSDYVTEVTGVLTPEDSPAEIAGKLTGYLVHVDHAQENGEAILDVFDCVSEELLSYYEPLFDPETEEYNDDLPLGSVTGTTLLIIHCIEILPQYRGNKLGAIVLLTTIDSLGESSRYCVAQPTPLQCSKEDAWTRLMRLASFAMPNSLATMKLQRHLRVAGFRQIRNTPFFLLDMGSSLPSLRTVSSQLDLRLAD